MKPTAERVNPVTILGKCVAVVLLLALVPSASNAASVGRLFCNGLATEYTDANAFTVLERATLNGDRFRGIVWVGLDPQRSFVPWTLKDLQDARRDLVLGFQLDDGVATGIHSAITKYGVAITLAFSHLKPGKHRLRIGLVNGAGDLTNDNAYCFSVPSYFTLTGPKPVGT